MICPKCQHENDKDSLYCINCGHQFDVTKKSNIASIILTILGLFSTSIFVVKGIESLNYIQSQISSYTDTINTYNNYLSNYDFSGSYDSISQMTLNSLNQIYTIGLIEVIILVIVAILAIASLILIYKKLKTAKYTLIGCGALIVMLAVPLIPALISSTTTNYTNELANSFNLFASIYLLGIVIGLIITAILYFVAALVYET